MDISNIELFKKPIKETTEQDISKVTVKIKKFQCQDKFDTKNENLFLNKKTKKVDNYNNYNNYTKETNIILGVSNLKNELKKKNMQEIKNITVNNSKQKIKYSSDICCKNLKNVIIEYILPPVEYGDLFELKIYSNLDQNSIIKLSVNDNVVPKSDLLLNRNWVTINYIDTEIYNKPKVLTIETYDVFNIKGIFCSTIDKRNIVTDNINLSCTISNKTHIYNHNKNTELKIGIIADNFTFENINYLFETKYINSNDNFSDINFNLLFCESAWGGLDESWRDQIFGYNTSQNINYKINKLINICKKKNIPTIFYAKEDPIFFDGFKNCSVLFDLVITTADECVSKYKLLGCKNVISTTFLINPKIHNPVKSGTINKLAFPGSYYNFLDGRCNIMDKILKNLLTHTDFDIFDRKYLHNKATYQIKKLQANKAKCEFPTNYTQLIKPGLTYSQVIDNIYKKYKCILNINTISDSSSMFSRRVMEVAGCGTNIISNESLGMRNIFGNNIIYLNEKNNYKTNIDLINMSPININLYETSHLNFTYKHLFKKIIDLFNLNITLDSKICIITDYNIKIDHKVKSSYTIFYNNNPIPTNTFDWYIYLNKINYFYDDIFIKKLILPIEYVDDHIAISVNDDIFTFNNDEIDADTFVLNTKKNIDFESLFENMSKNFSINNIYSPIRENYFEYTRYMPDKLDAIVTNKTNNNSIPVVLCLWNRIDRLLEQIKNLNLQTYNNFHLYIWNNNYNKKDLVDLILNKKIQKFNISCYHSQENIGGFGRFIMTKHILNEKDFSDVIFIDDDQILDTNVFSHLVKKKKKKCGFHWSGRKFYVNKNYWNSWSNIFTQNTNEKYNLLDYGGTGTMIIDTEFFNDDSFFYINKKYLFIEDLWMSYYAIKKYNYQLHNCSFLNVSVIDDQKDQSLNSNMKNLKNEFLQILRTYGDWNI